MSEPGVPGIAEVFNKKQIQLFSGSDMVAALLESAAQAIVSVDRAGNIVLANRRTEEMFGYSRPELVGSPVELLLPGALRQGHTKHRAKYFESPHPRPMGIGLDLMARRNDGTEFAVEVSLSHVHTDEGLFAIAFVSDISQRKRLEEQLMHSQKMEAVGRLAGGVAHDFNNMLTVIAGYERMILDELPQGDPLREYAEEVLDAAHRAAELTNQLLTFSRRQVIQPRVLNVNEVVRHIEKMLRRLIGEDIELLLNLSGDVGNIRTDPSHIEQAIVNLAVNSRDAMPNGGRIMIETSNAALDETYARTHLGVKPGRFVMIAVSDNGLGIDAETRQHIFEPFFTTKEKGKGTGLGLATVYGMVKQNGGDIWVYSEPGAGTSFKLYFPIVAASADPGTARPERTHRSGGETLLLVEDEKAVRELTMRILERLGYRVLAADSGDEALRISAAYEGNISLMLTDVVMPGMSGPQVADALKPLRPGMKVLFLSGYTENSVVYHGVLEPGLDFLPKPYSREALSEKIRSLLGDVAAEG
jgi:two-component system, cell cycle sensor histidine kinase and response regulator CckA